jgi:hypothetical protein
MTLKKELDNFDNALDDFKDKVYNALRIPKIVKWINKILKQ